MYCIHTRCNGGREIKSKTHTHTYVYIIIIAHVRNGAGEWETDTAEDVGELAGPFSN